MNDVMPTKFHKAFGNVQDVEITEGEIRLLQALIRDCEQKIISYRLKEVKIVEKIQKLWDSIKPYKEEAQESRIFIDEHPLFEAICLASGITPEQGRKKFYRRINDTLKRRLEKRRIRNDKNKEKAQSTTAEKS